MHLKIEKKCAHCGRDFHPRSDRQKFCSVECKRRNQNKRWYERHKEAERQRLNEANKRRRARQHNQRLTAAERENRRRAVVKSIKPMPPETPFEAAIKQIMKALDCSRADAIREAVLAYAATLP